MNSNGNIIPNDVKEAEKVDDFVFKSYTIPLYTHPAKTLTDEEIIDLWLPFATLGIKGKIAFARAIERQKRNEQ
jgi:hypothetical protein